MVQTQRVLLSVKRFKQLGNECSVAAASSLANYYDNSVNYENSRHLLPLRTRKHGLYTAQQAKLLNLIGFSKVNVVTSDLDIIDYSWSGLGKKGLIKKLERLHRYYSRTKHIHGDYHQLVFELYSWLANKEYDNNLIIDNDFAKYIRRSINRGRPVCVSVNANSLYKLKKKPLSKIESDIYGHRTDHSLVIRGYDNKGVFIVDSDSDRRFEWKKYSKGYYKLSWDKLLTNIPGGDLIFVE